ncbi:unnamed protein product [Paramecium sonneborni]|uniref:Uncharacterized protein n=1 Tax=Paramecium sonneborni TaxID=65129 RepID=A0A8S1PAZ9_9CILI|nr:unnamed protein product [Paramecium sonneborni]
MEFFQKLIAIPKNVFLSLKLLKQKKKQIQVTEPIKLSEDCKIETFEIIDQQIIIKKNQIAYKQIQTDLIKSKTKQNYNNKQKNKKKNKKSSKKLKKQEKYGGKQDYILSETSEKTKPSQYSYCQNNFLDSFEFNAKQINLQNVGSFYTSKRKSQKSTNQHLLNDYFNKIKLQLDEKEILIMKQQK